MSLYGRIEEYSDEEEWGQYVERLEHYFTANGIEGEDSEGRKKAILLSVMGPRSYRLVRDLVSPDRPGDKSYTELVEVLRTHYQPSPSEIVQRFKFNSRNRRTNESVAEFVADLRHKAEHCNYGPQLENMLRDRLVCGINDESIQRRLLSEEKLTFKKALEIALRMENAMKNVSDLRTIPVPEKVQYVKKGRSSCKQTKTFQHPPPPKPGSSTVCYRCTGSHDPDTCKHKKAKCHHCSKVGHLIRACRSNPQNKHLYKKKYEQYKQQHYVEAETEIHQTSPKIYEQSQNSETYSMFTVNSNTQGSVKPVVVSVKLNNVQIKMHVDTGASVTTINEDTYNKLKDSQNVHLEKCNMNLTAYTGQRVPVIGQIKLQVGYENQAAQLLAVVVRGVDKPNLLGRDWLSTLKLNWHQLFSITTEHENNLNSVLSEHAEVFKPGLGTLKNYKAHIYVNHDVQPIYCKARPVPFALKADLEAEYERLEQMGSLFKVQFSEWAAPVVPIRKPNKSIRVCGDFKVTINKASKLDNYPIPKTEDLLATLGGGVVYSKLDLSNAYQQIELDDESKECVTINTHRGLYRYNRLPYGVSSAPGIFQRTMENVLQGLDYVIVRVDDILLAGKNVEHHLEVLNSVLSRLEDAGLRLNKDKCVFMVPSVEYCGQRVSAKGIEPIPAKVDAVLNAPAPENLQQLQSYLGMLNYYHKYLPDIATELAPLHILLRKGVKWMWKSEQQKSFEKSKQMLLSAQVLTHFDSDREVVVVCDASRYGIGAVLAHKMDDGSEKPIAYASRTLNKAETRYAQLDKEGLAIIFAVKKFHTYLYGRRFTIFTDHKPLLGLFGEDKPIPSLASPRIQRWGLTLAAYEYALKFRPGKLISNADALSRLPLRETCSAVPVPGEIINTMEIVDKTLVTATDIRNWTVKDPILSTVLQFTKTGWPEFCPVDSLQPYWVRRHELSVHDDCILWGCRVIIPQQGQSTLLNELHETHPGVVRMKSLARNYVFWPGIDKDIEHKVKKCMDCQVNKGKTPLVPMHPWEYPAKPWSRIHIDYMGPVQNTMVLIIIDSYSKWIEAFPTRGSTSLITINKLKQAFATHGLPETVVSDNGPCFASEEFAQFMSDNGIQHLTSAPYHPASNGLAERAVQIVKNALEKADLNHLPDILLRYRITPQTVTGYTPAELLMKRQLRSKLDAVKPDLTKRVREDRQAKQKQLHDRSTRVKEINTNDDCYVSNFGSSGPRWLPGVVQEATQTDVHVRLNDDRIVRRHKDHVKPRHSDIPETVSNEIPSEPTSDNVTVNPPVTVMPENVNVTPRPMRNRTPPAYLKDYKL